MLFIISNHIYYELGYKHTILINATNNTGSYNWHNVPEKNSWLFNT